MPESVHSDPGYLSIIFDNKTHKAEFMKYRQRCHQCHPNQYGNVSYRQPKLSIFPDFLRFSMSVVVMSMTFMVMFVGGTSFAGVCDFPIQILGHDILNVSGTTSHYLYVMSR